VLTEGHTRRLSPLQDSAGLPVRLVEGAQEMARMEHASVVRESSGKMLAHQR